MERMLARNIDALEQFLDSQASDRATKGFVISVFSFCYDAFLQITADNLGVEHNLVGFKQLEKFLEKYPDRNIDAIDIAEFREMATALVADKSELAEFFKRTKRTNNAKYEVF